MREMGRQRRLRRPALIGLAALAAIAIGGSLTATQAQARTTAPARPAGGGGLSISKAFFGDTVEHVEQSLRAQHPATRNRVGPQPILQAGDDDQIPFVSQSGVGTEHLDLFCRRDRTAIDARQLQGRDVFDEPAQ